MNESVDIFQEYGISKSVLNSEIFYDIETDENTNPWDEINKKYDNQGTIKLKLETDSKDNSTINVLSKDYSNLSIFEDTSLNSSKKNENFLISDIEPEDQHKLLNPFNNDASMQISQNHLEIILTKIPEFKENMKKGCYDITSVGFNASKFLTLYSLLNNHSLNLSYLLNDVKLDEKKLQNVIQSNFNDILVLKSNLDSILKNYDAFLKGDTHYNHNYESLKNGFGELTRMANETHNELGTINDFLNNFDKIKENKSVMNLLCLPNLVLTLFELGRIDEMINILVLYDDYKNLLKAKKKNYVIFLKRIDDEVYTVLQQYRVKVLIETREDLRITNFAYQDLLLVNNSDQEVIDFENSEKIYKIFKRLLIINQNYNMITSLYKENITKEQDIEEEQVENVISYWLKIQLNHFEQSLVIIDKSFSRNLQINKKTINNKIAKNDVSSLRYLRNYLTFLSLDEYKEEVDEDEDDEDEEPFSNVETVLSHFYNININSKDSNDFWKKWNKLYEMVLPLLNNLSNFTTIVANLRNTDNSELYQKFLSELNENKKMYLVEELFDNNDYLLPKEYNFVEAFFNAKLNNAKNHKIKEALYDKILFSDDSDTIMQDIQIIENNIKENINLFVQNNILHKFFDNDNKELLIASDCYYLNWVRILSIFNSDLRSLDAKLNNKKNLNMLSHKFISILNELLLKDVSKLVLLEDWKPITQKNNVTISCLIFEKLLLIQSEIILDISEKANDQIGHLITACFEILLQSFLTSGVQLRVLNNLDYLQDKTIPKLSKVVKRISFDKVNHKIEEFKDKIISNYIMDDCKNLYQIINKATPYKSEQFSTYWSTFTIDNNDGFQISNNIIGSLNNFKIIESNINLKFKSKQLLNKVKLSYLEVIIEYFMKILSLKEVVNLSVDCFLQMGIDYFYILNKLNIPFDINALKSSKNSNNVVYEFAHKLLYVAFNDNLEQFENYFNEIYNILQTSI